MLRAEDRTVGVVVEDDEFRAPEQDDLRLGRQQHAHRAAQALRPVVTGPSGVFDQSMSRMRAPISPPPWRNARLDRLMEELSVIRAFIYGNRCATT